VLSHDTPAMLPSSLYSVSSDFTSGNRRWIHDTRRCNERAPGSVEMIFSVWVAVAMIMSLSEEIRGVVASHWTSNQFLDCSLQVKSAVVAVVLLVQVL
jgi:hypothetical protein